MIFLFFSIMKIENCFYIVALVLLKCLCIHCRLVLTIFPVGKVIISHENKDLNLTCKVTSEEKLNDRFDLTWKLPSKRKEKISFYVTNNENTITIHNLQEEDSGDYVCELNFKDAIQMRKISVYVKSRKCYHPLFDCGNNLCIPKHFVCDGNIDCPSGYDESFNHCGPDACHGKVLCDGRCIAKELCCDANVDANCTAAYVMPCCHKILNQVVERSSSQCTASVECRYGQMFGFGNSMLYIVASCAIAVMLVSSLFMIIVCRICTRNTEDFQMWPVSPSSRLRHQCTRMINHMDANADHLSDESCPLDDTINFIPHSNLYSEAQQSDDFVLVNFVPGSGFEIAECRPKPPPYTERIIGIPPPPYTSMVDVSNISDLSTVDVSNTSDVSQVDVSNVSDVTVLGSESPTVVVSTDASS